MAHIPILITIINKQSDEEGSEQSIRVTTEGRLYKRDNETVLLYKETKDSGLENTMTTVSIADDTDEVTMSRVGDHRLKMHFRAGNHYQTRMSTPFGDMDLNFTTQRLTVERGEDRGKIAIHYVLDFNNQKPLRNEISIKYRVMGQS